MNLKDWADWINKRKIKEPKRSIKKEYDVECMKIAKEIVRIRDWYECQKCGAYTNICSHVINDWSNTRMSVEPLNMKLLCHHHHFDRRHKKPQEATERFKEKFPWRYEKLVEMEINEWKWSIPLEWWENQLNSLKSLLAKMS